MKKYFYGIFFGILIGFLAGLVGVGGGEFRLPVLIFALGLPIEKAITANLLIGIFTVCASLIRRVQLGITDFAFIKSAAYMSVGSIPGAYFGAYLSHKASQSKLRIAVIIFLSVTGIRLILDPIIPVLPRSIFSLSMQPFALLATGLIIAVICGALGVAGGEYRIPALIFLFGLGIKEAGTASLLVSIPSLTVSLWGHINFKKNFQGILRIGAVMGIASVAGALIGANYSKAVSAEALKAFLGFILLLATIRMIIKE